VNPDFHSASVTEFVTHVHESHRVTRRGRVLVRQRHENRDACVVEIG
jgi:hypothetical protein